MYDRVATEQDELCKGVVAPGARNTICQDPLVLDKRTGECVEDKAAGGGRRRGNRRYEKTAMKHTDAKGVTRVVYVGRGAADKHYYVKRVSRKTKRVRYQRVMSVDCR